LAGQPVKLFLCRNSFYVSGSLPSTCGGAPRRAL